MHLENCYKDKSPAIRSEFFPVPDIPPGSLSTLKEHFSVFSVLRQVDSIRSANNSLAVVI